MNDWDVKYLKLAQEISTWSKDPSTKVGSVCVGKSGQILAQGYNGFPRHIKDTEERLNDRELKYKLIVHAEQNCIYNACLNGVSLFDSTMYLYGLPACSECSKGIIQVGINKVVMQYPSDDMDRWRESCYFATRMFFEAGVEYKLVDSEYNQILL